MHDEAFRAVCLTRFRFPVSGDVIVAEVSARGEGLRAMENAVLEGDHRVVQLAEQRYPLRSAQLLRIGADGAAGDAIAARALSGG